MAKFLKIIRENNENLLINKFIETFKAKIKQRLKNSKRFSFVLTGGQSPINLYQNLAKIKKINWRSVDFFIGDERYVKDSSKNSNINMCKKYFLNKINISTKQIFKIQTNSKSIRKDTENYEKMIKKYFLYKKKYFDLVLLGIGNDGHIASLFKKNITKNITKNVDFVRKKDFSRITLTIKCINQSNLIFLWAPGRKKSLIIKKVLLDKKFKYPASYLNKKNSFLFYSN
jgi:6-phosphogluconolactonase